MQTLVDFITGETVPDTGAEANRQVIERLLVNAKGFDKKDIEVDADIRLTIAGEPYRSQVDLVISVDEARFMTIKCAAGSLGSREREIVAAARLLDRFQIPLSVVSDGLTAIVLDTVSGKKIGEGLDSILSKPAARERLKKLTLQVLADKRREKEKLIFRTYDVMNVNVGRNIKTKSKNYNYEKDRAPSCHLTVIRFLNSQNCTLSISSQFKDKQFKPAFP